MKFIWMMNLTTALLSLAILVLGVRGLVTRKVIMFPSKWMLIAIGLNFLPLMLMPVMTYFQFPELSFNYTLLFFNLVLFGVLLAFLRRQMTGYSLLGVTDEALHSTLSEALRTLNLPYEESFSRIRLTSLPADLSVSVSPSLGIAQLSVKQAEHRATLERIAGAMNERFATGAPAAKMTTYVFYSVIGALLVAYVTYSYFRFRYLSL